MSKTNKKEILLISTPFLEYVLPSAQLAALQAYLESKNIIVNSLFSYVKFYECVGKKYADILNNTEYAEWIYIQYLHAGQYENEKEKIKFMIMEKLNLNCLEFQELMHKVFKFNEWLIDRILKSRCSLIGFSVTYNQLLPSLYIAREIKNRSDSTRIVFGGSRVNGDLGKSLLRSCNYIDTILSGEGEVSLYKYVLDYYENGINGAIVSKKYIEATEYVDINSLPIPEYRDYLAMVKECELNSENIFYFYEIARGCWWNRCTFCSSSRLYKIYREKNSDIVAQNLDEIYMKYGINKLWLLGDCYSFQSYKKLSEILGTLNNKFNLMAYSRCSLEKTYYSALKQMGVNTIIVGIEAISDSLLKKMDKGCTAIANMQCLKICSKLNINCVYNLFYSYPNFDKNDYQEMTNNIVYASGFQPPQSICDMELQFGSRVFFNTERYNITKVYPTEFDALSLPDKAQPFKYDYDKVTDSNEYSKEIINKVEKWNEIYEEYGMNKVLYYIEKENDIIIYDNRCFTPDFNIYLDDIQKELFLYCDTIKKIGEIENKFKKMNRENLIHILDKLTSYKIMFSSNDMYLSLPVQVNV